MTKQNGRKASTELNDVLVRGQFAVRLWDTWEAPSLILLLDGKEQRILRETFDIHWRDIDVHIGLVDEVHKRGRARDQRMRRDKGVKVIYELNSTEEGIEVIVDVQAMTHGVANPRLDDDGYPLKLTYQRVFPANRIDELFAKANAFVLGMEMLSLALGAKRKGDEKLFQRLNVALGHFHDDLNEVDRGGLTATMGEMAHKDEAKKPKKEKKPKVKAETIAVAVMETTNEQAESEASGDVESTSGGESAPVEEISPAPVVQAAPAPAPKPKKEKPKAIKLGTPEAAEKFAELGASVPSNGVGDANGQ